MCFGDSCFFPLSIRPPINVEYHQDSSYQILIGRLIIPRLVLSGPLDSSVVGELCVVALFEFVLE